MLILLYNFDCLRKIEIRLCSSKTGTEKDFVCRLQVQNNKATGYSPPMMMWKIGDGGSVDLERDSLQYEKVKL